MAQRPDGRARVSQSRDGETPERGTPERETRDCVTHTSPTDADDPNEQLRQLLLVSSCTRFAWQRKRMRKEHAAIAEIQRSVKDIVDTRLRLMQREYEGVDERERSVQQRTTRTGQVDTARADGARGLGSPSSAVHARRSRTDASGATPISPPPGVDALAPSIRSAVAPGWTEQPWLIPRVVNVVMLGSVAQRCDQTDTSIGQTCLDIRHIATHCPGAYMGRGRLATVQLGIAVPRCRVLLFRTGRLICAGASGENAARLGLLEAIRSIDRHAHVKLEPLTAKLINIVCSVDLRRWVDCESMSRALRSSCNYDRRTFVGLIWRPTGSAISITVYRTGVLNVAGPVTHEECIAQFMACLPTIMYYVR